MPRAVGLSIKGVSYTQARRQITEQRDEEEDAGAGRGCQVALTSVAVLLGGCLINDMATSAKEALVLEALYFPTSTSYQADTVPFRGTCLFRAPCTEQALVGMTP